MAERKRRVGGEKEAFWRGIVDGFAGSGLSRSGSSGALSRAAGFGAPVRAALARLAGRGTVPDAEDRLRAFLDDPADEVRVEVLRGLYSRGLIVRADQAAGLMRSADERLRAETVPSALSSPELVAALAADPSPMVRTRLADALRESAAGEIADRLRVDHHPHVRAAALTRERAAELAQDPTRETSWRVLARAARLARIPVGSMAPARPWAPRRPPAVVVPSPPVRFADSPQHRPLGRRAAPVAPLGLSGHYGLPVEGYFRAMEAGVNRLFWEPNYHTLTAFAQGLSPDDRRRLGFVAGTFEADPKRIRRDAERALRSLRVERLSVFLLFWVQSERRILPEVVVALEEIRERGLADDCGLSTHNRPLAAQALRDGWNPVMVRHSAAHRGAETEVFPEASQRGTGLMTFSATCYGRLLKPVAGEAAEPPSAADCLRYCMAQPSVSLVWTAPATLEQLDENLSALRDPELPADRRERLLAHGGALYAEETVFRRLVREAR